MRRAYLLITALMTVALLGQAGPVAANSGPIAQIICAPGEDMRQRLETQYRSHRAWAGLRNPDEVMELWEDADGDWALTIFYTSGIRCIVAIGDVFMPMAGMPHG